VFNRPQGDGVAGGKELVADATLNITMGGKCVTQIYNYNGFFALNDAFVC
jgi:hypothetical protein